VLEITFDYGDRTEIVVTPGELAIVNRATSEFGRGWWVAGYERVIWQPGDHLFWIGGDGSTRRYQWVGQTTGGRRLYTARKLDGIDSMTSEGAGASATYYRHLPRGAYIKFDGHGRHTETVNAVGRVTQFESYGCGRLSAISLAVPTGQPPRQWLFGYDVPNPSNVCEGQARLSSMATSAAVPGTYRQTNRQLGTATQYFQHAETGAKIQYTEANGRINSLTDVRDVATSFYYDTTSGLLNAAQIPTGRFGDNVTSTFRAGEGTAIASPDLEDELYTKIYSVRPAVTTPTKLWLGPWGNPLRIRDPLDRETKIFPHSTFALLPVRIEQPSGYSTYAQYNTHGNPLTVSADPDASAGGAVPTTTYEYAPLHPDNVTRVTDPTGVSTAYDYAIWGGSMYPRLIGQQTGSNPLRRASFEYCATANCLGLPAVTESPANAQGIRRRDSVFYDALGNLSRTVSAGGKCSEFLNDGIGRTIQSRVRVAGTCRTAAPPPPPPTCRKRICPLSAFADDVNWVRSETFFDALDRDTLSRTTALASGSTSTQIMEVRTAYDGFSGLQTEVTRKSATDMAVGTLRDVMQYDALGRLTRRFAQGANRTTPEEFFYDAAGNDTMRITARGHVIRTTYDALNRVATRTTPSVSYDSVRVGTALYAPFDPNRSPVFPRLPLGSTEYLTIDGDVANFEYDDVLNPGVGAYATGQLRSATNRDAKTWRRYYPNGRIAVDSQEIRATLGTNDFSQHAYTLRHRYDLAGRRIELTHPVQLAASLPGISEATTYSTETGLPSRVTDLGNRYVDFTFDWAGQLSSQLAPNGIRRDMTYTLDGELRTDQVFNGATGAAAPLPNPSGWARNATSNYDVRGKLLSTSNSTGLLDNLTSSYSPLGHLRASTYSSRAAGVTGNTVAWTSADNISTDALGNSLTGETRSTTSVDGSFGGGGSTSNWAAKSWQYATDSSGRLAVSTVGNVVSISEHDDGGNVQMQRTIGRETPSVDASERAMYYDALGQLVAVDARKGPRPGMGSSEDTKFLLLFDTHRYDALGRRILARSERICPTYAPTYWRECALNYVQRTVWDGARELWEIRMPDTQAYREQDGGYVNAGIYRQPGIASTDNDQATFDLSSHFGRVGYIYAGAIDQPLVVHRLGYGDRTYSGGQRRPYKEFAAFPLYPQWDVRGEPGLGSTADGGLWPCEGAGSSARCVYPMAWTSLWSPNGVALSDARPAWAGSLVENKRDGTGLLYRRNRYLDPVSGRFTQPDPIGLGGGLNSYGFAAGDPVNFSDPFGLCPICVAWAAFEVGSTIYDVYDLAKTGVRYLRGRASGVELAVTAAGVGAGVLGTGGGFGRAARGKLLESGSVFRSGTSMRARAVDEGKLSARNTLSNEMGKPPLFRPGQTATEIDVSKLPPGSARLDTPGGHVSITASEEEVKKAIIQRIRLPQ
jgi:RHS repeat-associated protein